MNTREMHPLTQVGEIMGIPLLVSDKVPDDELWVVKVNDIDAGPLLNLPRPYPRELPGFRCDGRIRILRGYNDD